MASSGTRGRGSRVGRPRGSRAAARARGAGLLDAELEHLPACDLIAHLNRHRTSQYEFVAVAHVLRARERRLAEAEARIRSADEVAGGLRDEIRRAADAEARLQAEVLAWKRRAADAEARLCGGPARLELEDPVAAEIELPDPDGARGVDAGVEVDGDVPLLPSPLRRPASHPAPVLDPTPMLLDDGALAIVPFEQQEPEHSPDTDSGVGRKDLEDVHYYQGLGEKGTGEEVYESEPEASNMDKVLQIEWGTAGSESEDGGSGNSAPGNEAAGGTNRRSSWKLRGTGTFYKKVFKALKEKERERAAEAAARPSYRCWLYAPRPSESEDVEDPDPESLPK